MKNTHLSIEPLEERLALSTNYFVSPTGNDFSGGTLAQPFATIQRAYNVMTAGDTAFFRGGTYDIASRITLQGKSGQAGNLLNFVPYQNEQPVFDFTTAAGNGAVSSGSFFTFRDANYIHLDGFELLKNGSDPNESRRDAITFRNVDFSIIENLDVHDFAGSGIQVIVGSHDNLIENNDVHDNVVNNNSNADGFWIGDDSHDNIVRGNRSFHNNDDGFDLWEAGSGNLLENNWAFENGKDPNGNVIIGDGNGFKLGRGFGQNTIRNNLSWRNKFSGFTDNSNSAVLTLYNNTSFLNGDGWFFGSSAQDILRNNISYLDSGGSFTGADDQFNSWNPGIGFASSSDFVTTNDLANRGSRQADGSLPISEFLHLVEGSDLRNSGIDVGLPFQGSAPDLGAFQFIVELPSADFDGDGDTDGSDFLAWQRGFGTSNANKPDGDADNDSDVDFVDLGFWHAQYGATAPSASAASIAQEAAPLASAFAGLVFEGRTPLSLSIAETSHVEEVDAENPAGTLPQDVLLHDAYFSRLSSADEISLQSESSRENEEDATTTMFDELGFGVDASLSA